MLSEILLQIYTNLKVTSKLYLKTTYLVQFPLNNILGQMTPNWNIVGQVRILMHRGSPPEMCAVWDIKKSLIKFVVYPKFRKYFEKLNNLKK